MNLEMGDIKEFIQELKERKIKEARIFSSFVNDGYTTAFKIRLTANWQNSEIHDIISCELQVGREYNIDSSIQALAEKTKAHADDLRKIFAKEKISLKPGVWKP